MYISCLFHIIWARNRGERTQLGAEMGLQHQPQQQPSLSDKCLHMMFRNINLKICNLHVFIVLFCIIWHENEEQISLCIFWPGTSDQPSMEHGAREAVASLGQEPGDSQSRWWRCDHCTVVPVMSMSCHQWYIFYETAIWGNCWSMQSEGFKFIVI